MGSFDVAVIGGGIIGTSAAAYLAEAGRSVILLERAELAAGASGRNSGAIQHPFDPSFAELHRLSLTLYGELTLAADGFELPARPEGLMLVSFDPEAVEVAMSTIVASTPELAPALLAPGEAAKIEPTLNARLAACRLETGYPVAPAAATLAFANRARRAGATLRTEVAARPHIESGRIVGISLAGDEAVGCGQVLVAAGPWSASLVPGWNLTRPITSSWGVVVSTTLRDPPRHVLEEIGIDRPDDRPDRAFSLVTSAGNSSVGSTFLASEPDAAALAGEILERGARFVPELGHAEPGAIRACARPMTLDGRPIIGALESVAGLYICAGHGPWGISTGPGSARLVAHQMLGWGTEHPDFSPARLQT